MHLSLLFPSLGRLTVHSAGHKTTAASAKRQPRRAMALIQLPVNLQRLVRAVAERCVLGLLAGAKISLLGFVRRVFHRRKFRPLVRTVAKGLRFASTTGAPPVIFTLFDINSAGCFRCNFGLAHGYNLLKRKSGVRNHCDQKPIVTSFPLTTRSRIGDACRRDRAWALLALHAGNRN